MRQNRTSVAGKRFERGDSDSNTRLFARRGRGALSIDVFFLLLVAAASLFAARDLSRYFTTGNSVDVAYGELQGADVIPIDSDKGDVDAALAASGFGELVNSTADGAEQSKLNEYLRSGAEFSDSTLEQGSDTADYRDDEPKPVPMPPAGAPVLFPEEAREDKAQIPPEARLPSKRPGSKRHTAGISVKAAERVTVTSSPPKTHDTRGSPLASTTPSSSRRSVLSRHNSGSASSSMVQEEWRRPFQPIQDPQRHISFSDLQSIFGLLPSNLTLVNQKTMSLLKNYDVREDPLFKDLALRGNLTLLSERYVPVARRGWGGLLANAPPSVPADHLYHVRYSGDEEKGYGMYASTNIPAGTVIGTYGGELKIEGELRNGQYAWEAPLMRLQNKVTSVWSNVTFVLDGGEVGNLLRFVNDLGKESYNLEPIWVPVDNRWTLFYETTRPVPAGEELSIPYGDDYWTLAKSKLTPNSSIGQDHKTAREETFVGEQFAEQNNGERDDALPASVEKEDLVGPDTPVGYAFRKILLQKRVLHKKYLPAPPSGSLVAPVREDPFSLENGDGPERLPSNASK